MIEHLRGERTVLRQLYGDAGRLVETTGTPTAAGTVRIEIGGTVAEASTFRQALLQAEHRGIDPGALTMNEQIDTDRSRSRSTEQRDATVRRLTEAERQRDRRTQQRDIDIPLPEAPTDTAGVGSFG